MVIGSSTGGPAALQDILPSIPASFPYPILLVQHMPKTFTSVFAQRLNGICQINIKEAEDGDVLKPGHAYLAPGGSQMILSLAEAIGLKFSQAMSGLPISQALM
ncbi:chemotaxis protein CheB [Aliamphritea spongicola]|nr:chemotaxis protein CheB [Aliamphritea spongicola]